jgi:hypothetical protein
MPTDIKVVLFEDTAQTQSEMLNALAKHLKPGGAVILFDGTKFSESEEDKNRTYEDRLENILKKEPFAGATLLVADRDLSKSVSAGFRGLSVTAVAAAAKKLAIPVCSYARQPDPDHYDWRGRWEEGHIVLPFSEGEDELAHRASVAARGFSQIAAKLPEVIAGKGNNSAVKIMAALLGKPDYSEKIALYGVGDQNRLSEILSQAKHTDQRIQRMTHFLGYWLWDSLLRYPGLFVNEIAAGSYLNISEADFHESTVQAIFQDALYHGPFEDSKRPHWWRGVLDDIVARENTADGLELAQKKISSKINRSQCCVDSTKSAGYYCIISRKPVSLENSKGGLSWFPRGADLTRISNPKFDEYGPWLGA